MEVLQGNPGRFRAIAALREPSEITCATVMFGRRPDGTEVPPPMDLVRLAIPRRVYTQSHIDYAAEAVIHVASQKDRLRGYRMTSGPAVLRHFTSRFEPR